MTSFHQIKPFEYYQSETDVPKWLSTSMKVIGNVVGISTTDGFVDLDENDFLILNDDQSITITHLGMRVIPE